MFLSFILIIYLQLQFRFSVWPFYLTWRKQLISLCFFSLNLNIHTRNLLKTLPQGAAVRSERERQKRGWIQTWGEGSHLSSFLDNSPALPSLGGRQRPRCWNTERMTLPHTILATHNTDRWPRYGQVDASTQNFGSCLRWRNKIEYMNWWIVMLLVSTGPQTEWETWDSVCTCLIFLSLSSQCLD